MWNGSKTSRLHKCILSMDFLILPRNSNRYLCGYVNFYKSLFRRKNYATEEKETYLEYIFKLSVIMLFSLNMYYYFLMKGANTFGPDCKYAF